MKIGAKMYPNEIVVDKSGKVKATGKGKTYIYVNEDGTKVKCRVIVK